MLLFSYNRLCSLAHLKGPNQGCILSCLQQLHAKSFPLRWNSTSHLWRSKHLGKVCPLLLNLFSLNFLCFSYSLTLIDSLDTLLVTSFCYWILPAEKLSLHAFLFSNPLHPPFQSVHFFNSTHLMLLLPFPLYYIHPFSTLSVLIPLRVLHFTHHHTHHTHSPLTHTHTHTHHALHTHHAHAHTYRWWETQRSSKELSVG